MKSACESLMVLTDYRDVRYEKNGSEGMNQSYLYKIYIKAQLAITSCLMHCHYCDFRE